jgi:TetR/AcrR family transcriptional regulator, regulator of biofilm formation and stress response
MLIERPTLRYAVDVGYVDNATRRRQLIDATIGVIATHGVEGVTTRRIAEAAEAPLASIHYTFGSKEELLSSAVEQLLDDLSAEVHEAVARAESLTEALRTVMATVGDLLDQPRYVLLMADIPGLDSDRMLEAWRRYQRMGPELIADVVSRSGEQLALPVEQVGRLVIAAIDGVLERHLIDDDETTAKADLEVFGRAITTIALGS